MRYLPPALDRFSWSTTAEQRRCLLELVDNAMSGKTQVTMTQIQSLLYFSESKGIKEMIMSDLEYGERVLLVDQLLSKYPDVQLWPSHDSVSLPDELWCMIFGFLGFGDDFYNARHTCRYLFDISSDPGIWKSLESMTLPIPYCLEIHDNCVWVNRASKIRSLTCQSDFLAQLHKVCPKLRLRFVRQIHFQDHSRLVDSDLIQCLRICEQAITVLDLSKCESISDIGVQAIGTLCPNLEHLVLDGCQLLTDASLRYLPRSLKQLSISRCSQITDTGIIAFCSSPSSSTINHLDINLCSRVTERGLLDIASSCSKLSSLLMAEAGATPAVLSALSQKCFSLTKVDISFGTADRESLFDLMHGCPLLCHIIAVRTKGIGISLAADLRTYFPELRLELYHEDVIPMSRALIQWR